MISLAVALDLVFVVGSKVVIWFLVEMMDWFLKAIRATIGNLAKIF